MNYPMKGIINFSNYNWSYVHSVIQSLSCLESSKQLVVLNRNNPILNSPLFAMTNSFINLINTLICGMEGNSADIIQNFKNSYIKHQNSINSKNVLSNDPYHFLHYSLQFLHLENNMAQNPNFNINILNNQNIQNKMNDDYMYCLFLSFFLQTQNSFVTKYFLNIEKYIFKCTNCSTTTFSYGIKKIIRINVDMVRYYRDLAFPYKKGMKINLDDCFRCYIGGNSFPCKFCGNQNSLIYRKFCCSAKILMIFLDRTNHSSNLKNDIIEIQNRFNIGNYYSISRTTHLNYNPNYILKACISYCSMGKYFADCYINTNNNFNSGWYRFMDNQIKYLSNPFIEINEFEPQLLIYELDDSYNNDPWIFFNNFTNLRKNNNNMDIFNQNIQNIFNDMRFGIYANFMEFQPIQQSVGNAQIQNENIMKYLKNDSHSLNINMNVNPLNTQVNNFQLRFSIVPEEGDQTFETNLKIFAQVRSTSTVEEAIENFFKKALKKKEAIKKFLHNDNVLDEKSQQTLDSLNINENTIIKAIKADNFDNLNIV